VCRPRFQVAAGHGPAFERCLADPARAQDPIPEAERQMCAPDIDVDATEELAWRVPREVASLFVAVRESFRARLRAESSRPASDSAAFSALLDHALATWTLRDPSKPKPDPVFERDGYRCAVPGCSSRMSWATTRATPAGPACGSLCVLGAGLLSPTSVTASVIDPP
jgi:hypothetical protein